MTGDACDALINPTLVVNLIALSRGTLTTSLSAVDFG